MSLHRNICLRCVQEWASTGYAYGPLQFDIEDILVPMGLQLNIPLQHVRSQFREGDVVRTQRIARVLIPVERAIGGMKNSVM